MTGNLAGKDPWGEAGTGRGMRFGGWLPGVVLALVLSAVAPALAQEQEWYKYYEDARQAMKGGRWQDAEQSLMTSIKKYPKPKRRAETHSHLYISYYPYYHLAQVYYQLGKYESAQSFLQLSDQFKEIPADDNEFAPQLAGLKAQVLKAQQEAAAAGSGGKGDPAQVALLDQAQAAYQRGDYETARWAFQQVAAKKGGPAAETAAGCLAQIDAEESALREGKSLAQAGKPEEAVPFLQKVVGMGHFHAAEAGKLLSQINEAAVAEKTSSRVFNEYVNNARNLGAQGKYAQAVSILQSLTGADAARPEVQRVKAEIVKSVLAEADRCLQQGNPARAEELCRVGEDLQLDQPGVHALRSRIDNVKKMTAARQLMTDKQWEAAETALKTLQQVPDLRIEADRYLHQITTLRDRLAGGLAEFDRLFAAGETAAAGRVLDSLRVDFPDRSEVQTRLRRLQDENLKRGGPENQEENLQTALDIFFENGEYARAIVFLDIYLGKNGPRRDLALFFRAMARIYLFRLEDDDGKQLLESARRDVTQISPGFQPPRRWLSRKALDYFDRWRSGK